MSENQLTFLGTGTSTGIPIIGCPCQICQSPNPKNKRLRSSVLINSNKHSFVIDTGPDLRTQLLRENVTHLDFALVTHEHADHLHGMDDLRPFTFLPERRTFPVFSDQVHHQKIKTKFDYIFNRDQMFGKDNPYQGGGLPLLDLYELDEVKNQFEEESFSFITLPHGKGKTTGIIHDTMAYIIDCHEIPQDQLRRLSNSNIHTLVIDCLRIKKHTTHLCYQQAVDYIKAIKPKKAYLTHIGHEVDHEELFKLSQSISEVDVAPAYDGLKVSYPKP